MVQRMIDGYIFHLFLLDCLLHALHNLLKRVYILADSFLHLPCELLHIAE
jgi:hypothetical protein